MPRSIRQPRLGHRAAGLAVVTFGAGCFVALPDHAERDELVDAGGPDGATARADANGADTEGAGAAAMYRDEVLADKPAAYWFFDETTGRVATDRMSPSGGTFEGGPRLGGAGLLPIGTAVEFDGVDDMMVAAVTPSTVDQFTLEALVKLPKLPTRQAYRCALFAVEEPGRSGFRFGIGDSGEIVFWTDQSGGKGEVLSGPVIKEGVPFHIAVVRDGPTVRIYASGVEVAAGEVTLVPSTAPFDVAGVGYSQFFAGTIDEPAVYLEALPASRLAVHARAAGLER